MKEIQIKEHTNNMVAKSNALITAKGYLSGSSQKMLASVISMLRTDDTEFTRYALNRKDYLKLINSSSNNDEFFKETAKELMQNPFVIEGRIYNWCSEVDLVSTQGYVVFDIHPRLKPYLLELKDKGNFTQYKVVNILSLKGEYSPKLYEYITMKWNAYKGYHKKASSFTFEFNIEDMRELLQVPKSYKYYDIKRQILDKAVKQFKEKTDIQISYKEQKIGRKVDRIIVTVKENNKGSNDYMSSRKAFIDHIREMYKPNADQGIYPIICTTSDNTTVRVDNSGKVYTSANQNITREQSNKLWDWLYQLAKDGELKVQTNLFDDTVPTIQSGGQQGQKANLLVDLSTLTLTSKWMNFGKSLNLTEEEITLEFNTFLNHHRSEETEPQRNWLKLWNGWLANGIKQRGL